MHEILSRLDAGALVLDLGSASGSFDESATAATVIRLDLEKRGAGRFVQGDAARLPFADATFSAVISNHSLEHIAELDAALAELGRVLRPSGALFVAVPDASTVTDRLYRWLARGGGHVNPFYSPGELAARVERLAGLPCRETRTLYSSLSFLNRRNARARMPMRALLVGGGFELPLFAYNWASRRIDRWFGWRTSIYGWAFYFGSIPGGVDGVELPNVCLRCGSGVAVGQTELVRRFWVNCFRCPRCGTANPLAGEG